MFTIRPPRKETYTDDPTFRWKYILRSIAFVLAIISIGLIGWSLAHQVDFPNNIYDNDNDNHDYASYYYRPHVNGTRFLPWSFITLGLSIVWNVAHMLVLLTRHRSIHPGANVACDLLLWLGLTVTGFFATVGAGNSLWWYPDNYNQGSLTTTSPPSSSSNICEPSTNCTTAQTSHVTAVINRTGVVIALGAAVIFIVALMHFALFVSACRYTSARRVNPAATSVRLERMCGEERTDGHPNAGFVPINDPVE